MARRASLAGLQSVAGKDPRTPGMLGTGGFDPATDPLGLDLHQRAQAHEDSYYQIQHEQDQQPNTDPRLVFAHQTNEARNRINNMNAGGWGDWLYAFNEATGGKGRFAPGTTFTDSPDQTYDPTFQTSAVDPNADRVHRAVLDMRGNPQYYGGQAPSLKALSSLLKGKKVQT